MIKPDGVKRRLIGEIISRLEHKGLRIIAMKMLLVSKEAAQKHYAVHKGKPFFEGLIKFISSGPVVAMIVEGNDAIKHVRKLIGSTNPLEAEIGSIRGEYSIEIGRNIIHGADSPENSKYEYSIYFKESEIVTNEMTDEKWIYE